MTFPLGRYGDNHVTPDVLFDPGDPTARPPDDAVDMQFRHPVSLNVMLDAMARAGQQDLLDQWQRMFAELAEDTTRWVQRSCGWVVDAQRSGLAPARLAITTIRHDTIPGFDVARHHLHVYIGGVGTSLIDDRRLPTSWDSVDEGRRGPAQRRHINQVWKLTTEGWGVRWDQPRPGAEDEIVDPPWHEHIDSLDRGVCPGPAAWGSRRVMVADAEAVRMAAEDEEFYARNDPGWSRAKLLFEDDDDFPAAATG